MAGLLLICLLSIIIFTKNQKSNKLIRARPKLYMLSDNPIIFLEIADCSLFTRIILVVEANHQ